VDSKPPATQSPRVSGRFLAGIIQVAFHASATGRQIIGLKGDRKDKHLYICVSIIPSAMLIAVPNEVRI